MRLVPFALAVVAAAFLFWRFSAEGGADGSVDVAASGGDVTQDGDATVERPDRLVAARSENAERTRAAASEAPAETVAADAPESVTDEPVRASLVVEVVDDATDAPVAGLALDVWQPLDDAGAKSYVTDERGVIETPAVLVAGTVHLSPPPADPELGQWSLDPEAVVIEPGMSRREVVVRAERWREPIDVIVLGPDSKPVEGAAAVRVLGVALSEDSTHWNDWRRRITDADGRARFFVRPEARQQPLGLFVQEAPGHLRAEPIVLAPPTHAGPWTLHAHPPSSVVVTVLGPGDVPIIGARVRATRPTRLGARMPGPVLTDGAGRARVAPLGAGRRTVEVQLDGAREWIGDTDVELLPGQEAQATIRLAKDDLPRLAVAGRVVDENGAALPDVGVTIEVQGGRGEFVITDERGAFELSTATVAEKVTVRAGASIFGDRFDPSVVEVPFGTRGVEVRRTEALEDVFVLFELVDATDGSPIPDSADPAIIVYRRPGPDGRVHAVARFGPTNGVTEVDFHPHEDLDWFVVAPGYREARGTIDLPEPGGPPTVHRVRLERGFARGLTVRDSSNGTPLAGAKVIDAAGTTLGTTANDGFVQLLGAAWPDGALTVHRDGYAPKEWDPAFYWSHHDGAVWLDRR